MARGTQLITETKELELRANWDSKPLPPSARSSRRSRPWKSSRGGNAQERGFGADGEIPVPVAGLLQPVDRVEGSVAPAVPAGCLAVVPRRPVPNLRGVVEDELLDGAAAVAAKVVGPLLHEGVVALEQVVATVGGLDAVVVDAGQGEIGDLAGRVRLHGGSAREAGAVSRKTCSNGKAPCSGDRLNRCAPQ